MSQAGGASAPDVNCVRTQTVVDKRGGDGPPARGMATQKETDNDQASTWKADAAQ